MVQNVETVQFRSVVGTGNLKGFVLSKASERLRSALVSFECANKKSFVKTLSIEFLQVAFLLYAKAIDYKLFLFNDSDTKEVDESLMVIRKNVSVQELWK